MPCITVQSLELADVQKKRIAERYIEVFSEETGVPKDRIYLFFDGYKLNEASTNGELFSERKIGPIRGKFNEKEWNAEWMSTKQS